VDTEQRVGGFRDLVVENMPGASNAIEAGCFNKPGPPGIKAGETGGRKNGGRNRTCDHQRSSITAVLMPEPMPISNT